MTAVAEPTFHFDPTRHIYTLDGVAIPSVTQALKSAGMIDYSMIPQDVLLKASRRGTAVHQAIHYWLDGELDESTVDPEHLGYLNAARRCIDDLRFTVMRVECRHWHPLHRYAGTYDLDGLMVSDDSLIDWKTGVIMEGHAFQLAGYAMFKPAPRRYRRLAVQLRADGTYRVHEFPSPQWPGHTFAYDQSMFLAALQCAKFNMQNGGKVI